MLPNYENVEGSRGGRQAASPSPSMMTQVRKHNTTTKNDNNSPVWWHRLFNNNENTTSSPPPPTTTTITTFHSQGQYRAAASQAKVATIPEGDLAAATSLASMMANSKASNNMLASQSARVHNSSTVSGSPSYIPMGSRGGQRTPLATSSPSQIPTFQR